MSRENSMKLPNSSRQCSGNTRYVAKASNVFLVRCERVFVTQQNMGNSAPGTKIRVSVITFSVLLGFACQCLPSNTILEGACNAIACLLCWNSTQQSMSSKYTIYIWREISCSVGVKLSFQGLSLGELTLETSPGSA